MSAPRVARIVAILGKEYPYRVDPRKVRRILSVLPAARRRHRAAQDRFIAAIVALPHRLGSEPRNRS